LNTERYIQRLLPALVADGMSRKYLRPHSTKPNTFVHSIHNGPELILHPTGLESASLLAPYAYISFRPEPWPTLADIVAFKKNEILWVFRLAAPDNSMLLSLPFWFGDAIYHFIDKLQRLQRRYERAKGLPFAGFDCLCPTCELPTRCNSANVCRACKDSLTAR